MLFLNIRPMYHCIKLSYKDIVYHLFISVHNICFIDNVDKGDDKVDSIIV